MAKVLPDSNLKLIQLLAAYDARLRALERNQPTSITFNGLRNDDPRQDGSFQGPRVRIGLLSDGSYGIEMFGRDSGAQYLPTWNAQ